MGVLKQKDIEVLLTGDFNAHTGTATDYMRLTDTRLGMQVPFGKPDNFPEESTLRRRSNMDWRSPSSACWGKELLNMCAAGSAYLRRENQGRSCWQLHFPPQYISHNCRLLHGILLALPASSVHECRE